MPPSVLCSSCQTSIWKASQASPYNGYDLAAALTWRAIQKKCGTSYPTGVQPFPNITLPNETNGGQDAQPCLSGKTYTVKTGDTCRSIALANSVAEGTIWALNNLFADCSSIQSGQSLCLPNQCTTYTMSPNETCIGVAFQNAIPFANILSWNPTINSDCSNLSPKGSVICISSPFPTWSGTVIAGGSPTQTGSYATATAAPPTQTAFGTTLNCGNCIAIELLHLINPSIDSDCYNLVPGLAYCVQPTSDWNATTIAPATTIVAPPGPTESGTTSTCYLWHIVAANETCAITAASYGITFAQFRFWNQFIDADCTNLEVGEAYCMSGPPIPTGSITAGGTSTPAPSTTSAPAASPTPGSCSRRYTVASGDYCFKIWTNNKLTEAQFRALNPGLDADCNVNIGQVLCVAA
ncbi:MAG: hypothetical protein M1839_001111 [Geoglossum umbratile]|nr:MAG: hypothetical protein M1839_001111 [Geoglossum umbratile]